VSSIDEHDGQTFKDLGDHVRHRVLIVGPLRRIDKREKLEANTSVVFDFLDIGGKAKM
jgi:hypothetical protein